MSCLSRRQARREQSPSQLCLVPLGPLLLTLLLQALLLQALLLQALARGFFQAAFGCFGLTGLHSVLDHVEVDLCFTFGQRSGVGFTVGKCCVPRG